MAKFSGPAEVPPCNRNSPYNILDHLAVMWLMSGLYWENGAGVALCFFWGEWSFCGKKLFIFILHVDRDYSYTDFLLYYIFMNLELTKEVNLQ